MASGGLDATGAGQQTGGAPARLRDCKADEAVGVVARFDLEELEDLTVLLANGCLDYLVEPGVLRDGFPGDDHAASLARDYLHAPQELPSPKNPPGALFAFVPPTAADSAEDPAFAPDPCDTLREILNGGSSRAEEEEECVPALDCENDDCIPEHPCKPLDDCVPANPCDPLEKCVPNPCANDCSPNLPCGTKDDGGDEKPSCEEYVCDRVGGAGDSREDCLTNPNLPCNDTGKPSCEAYACTLATGTPDCDFECNELVASDCEAAKSCAVSAFTMAECAKDYCTDDNGGFGHEEYSCKFVCAAGESLRGEIDTGSHQADAMLISVECGNAYDANHCEATTHCTAEAGPTTISGEGTCQGWSVEENYAEHYQGAIGCFAGEWGGRSSGTSSLAASDASCSYLTANGLSGVVMGYEYTSTDGITAWGASASPLGCFEFVPETGILDGGWFIRA